MRKVCVKVHNGPGYTLNVHNYATVRGIKVIMAKEMNDIDLAALQLDLVAEHFEETDLADELAFSTLGYSHGRDHLLLSIRARDSHLTKENDAGTRDDSAIPPPPLSKSAAKSAKDKNKGKEKASPLAPLDLPRTKRAAPSPVSTSKGKLKQTDIPGKILGEGEDEVVLADEEGEEDEQPKKKKRAKSGGSQKKSGNKTKTTKAKSKGKGKKGEATPGDPVDTRPFLVKKGTISFSSTSRLDLFFSDPESHKPVCGSIHTLHLEVVEGPPCIAFLPDSLRAAGNWLGSTLRVLRIVVSEERAVFRDGEEGGEPVFREQPCDAEAYLPLLMKLHSLEELSLIWDISPTEYRWLLPPSPSPSPTSGFAPLRASKLLCYLKNMNPYKPLRVLRVPYLELDDPAALLALAALPLTALRLDWPARFSASDVVALLVGLKKTLNRDGGLVLGFAPSAAEEDGREARGWRERTSPGLSREAAHELLGKRKKYGEALMRMLVWEDGVDLEEEA